MANDRFQAKSIQEIDNPLCRTGLFLCGFFTDIGEYYLPFIPPVYSSSHAGAAKELLQQGLPVGRHRQIRRQFILQDCGRRRYRQAVLVLDAAQVDTLEEVKENTAECLGLDGTALCQKFHQFSFHMAGTHLFLIRDVGEQDPHRCHDGRIEVMTVVPHQVRRFLYPAAAGNGRPHGTKIERDAIEPAQQRIREHPFTLGRHVMQPEGFLE